MTHINISIYCCDWKSLSSMFAKLRAVAASNNRVHMPWSLYCLFAPRIHIVVLHAHPVRGESHIQCNWRGCNNTTQKLLV